jgi:hypothetical protein
MLASESFEEAVNPLNTVEDPRSFVCQHPADAATVVSVIGIGNSNNFKTDVITDPVTGSQEALRSREGSMAHESENRSWPAVKNQARALAVCIEGHSTNLGAFVKLVRECEARTILAAVIATLIREHIPCGRGPLKRPGGFFTRRCQQFQRDDIPSEVALWVERCGHLSYQEIDAALEAAARVHSQMDDHPSPRRPARSPPPFTHPVGGTG